MVSSGNNHDNWFLTRQSVWDRPVIKLELSAACNASCSFCFMHQHPKKSRELMKIEDLRRFLKLSAAWIQSQGFELEPFFNGESLIHPKFHELIGMIVSAGCRLGGLDTNLGVECDIEQLSAHPFVDLTVNIGGITADVHERVMGVSFNRVLENLHSLYASPSRSYPLFVKMNPVKDNVHQLELLDDFVMKIGTEILIKPQMTGFLVPEDYPESKLSQLLERIWTDSHLHLFRFRPDSGGTGKVVPVRTTCLYQAPCINSDGSLTLCAHDQLRHFHFGNVFEKPLSELLKQQEYQEAIARGKRRELPICKRCN